MRRDMSDMHAETALWIDGLRKRADEAEHKASGTDVAVRERRELDERLARFRTGLNLMGNDQVPSTGERSTLDKMADELDQAVSKMLAKVGG